MIDLIDEQEARDRIRERLNGRQWWVIPWVSEGSATISTLVEETHYSDEANTDFETMLGFFGGVLAITFAHKRRMDRKQYAEVLASSGAVTGDMKALERLLERQDIVMAMSGPDDDLSVALALSWHSWVMGDDGWEPMKNLN